MYVDIFEQIAEEDTMGQTVPSNVGSVRQVHIATPPPGNV
jgi:hypothetical protein